jgi:Flp pilus assembly protein TadG
MTRKPYFTRGQAFVEFALLAPILLYLLIAAGDLMRVYYMAIALNNAAQAGVEYGAQNPHTAADVQGMQQAAKNDASDISGMTATASLYCECPGSSSSFACDSTNNCSDKRAYVEVDTSATFQMLVKYPGIPTSIPLNGKAPSGARNRNRRPFHQ